MVRILTILVVVGLIVNGLTFLMVANYFQEEKAAAAQPASPPPKAVETAPKQPAIQPVNPELLRRLTTIETSINSLSKKVDNLAARAAAPAETHEEAPAAPRSPPRGAITGDRRRPASAKPESTVQPVNGDVPVEAEAAPEGTPEAPPPAAGSGGVAPGQPAPEAPPPAPVEGESPPPADPGSGAGTPPGTPPGESSGAGGEA